MNPTRREQFKWWKVSESHTIIRQFEGKHVKVTIT